MEIVLEDKQIIDAAPDPVQTLTWNELIKISPGLADVAGQISPVAKNIQSPAPSGWKVESSGDTQNVTPPGFGVGTYTSGGTITIPHLLTSKPTYIEFTAFATPTAGSTTVMSQGISNGVAHRCIFFTGNAINKGTDTGAILYVKANTGTGVDSYVVPALNDINIILTVTNPGGAGVAPFSYLWRAIP